MKFIKFIILLIILSLQNLSAAEVWSGLGSGMDHDVLVLASSENYIYAGGDFTTADGITVNRIARWNKVTQTWSAMEGGVSGGQFPYVHGIIVRGDDVFVGGQFLQAGNVPANNIAVWNELTESWSTLGDGLDSTAHSITFLGDSLIVAGDFTNAGALPCSHVAVYNFQSSMWENLGVGIPAPDTVAALVTSVVANRNGIYVAGQFDSAGTVAATNIAKWDLNMNEWEPLIDNSTGDSINGIGSVVLTLKLYEDTLYAGGWFTSAGPTNVNRIAKWDGTQWYAMGTIPSSIGPQVNDILILDPNNIYMAVMENASYDGSVRKWDGAAWNKVNTDAATGGFDPFGGVQSLILDENKIYVGGRFGNFGAKYKYIAKFEDPDNPYAYSKLSLKTFLEGAYNAGSLNTTLNNNGMLPTEQPFNQEPWNYSGTESVSSDDVAPGNSVPDYYDNHLNIVDWVLIELRTNESDTSIVERKACFLLSDGTLMGVDGSNPLLCKTFGNVYAVIYHRNHLSIMSSNKFYLTN